VQYSLLPDTYRDAMEQGLFFEEPVIVEIGSARLKVVLRDASTGALGSVLIPVRQR
jgi:hypothetical protein